MTLPFKGSFTQLHSLRPADVTVGLQSVTHRFLLDEKLCIFQMASNVLTQALPLLFIQYLHIEGPHLLSENAQCRESNNQFIMNKTHPMGPF